MKNKIDLPKNSRRSTDSRSIAWQEQWIAGVKAGIEDTNRGDFVSEEEITRVLTRYYQA
ncbi:transcriptional regulator [Agrobacterium rosae]|uniref:transcriptional regulator n=1 Tax=Agrobacterium rosae TaxID=1972867 RepID=UPI003BA2E3D1